ncbi:MAG: class I SAM-dependent RNA methyltransferase, partial [Phycisphaerales bacterium]|nr:class I SAM-dependent RNA methyltransferase [Phycisphaerales bacterium]
MPALDLIATSAFGLERVVQRELADLGYEAKPYETGRIAFAGEALAVCRANLWLRCADRVLVRLDTFPCADFDTLFERTKAIAWSDLILKG